MAKIQNLPKSKLKNNELLAVSRDVEAKIVAAGASDLGVGTVFSSYQAALQAYDDSIVTISKSAMTTEKKAADKVRDDMQTGIFTQIRLFTNHFKAEWKAAALRLLPLADRFKGTTQLSYDDQTGLVYNFVQAAESDTYKADFALLGLTEWVAELKKANQKCDELTNVRREEKGERNMLLKVEQTRPALETAYDKLVEALNANALVNGEEKYLALFAWWNAMIDEFRVTISLRRGKGKGGKTDGGSSNQPNPDAGSGGSEEERPGEL